MNSPQHALARFLARAQRMEQAVAEYQALRLVQRDVGPHVLDHVEVADRPQVRSPRHEHHRVLRQGSQHRWA